jgi:diphosphomevalonate decarboxylase
MKATARAFANVALAKYWGKSDTAQNLPAVPSLSLTLDPLATETTVEFDSALAKDEAILNGHVAEGRPLARIVKLLDDVRAEAGVSLFAHVETNNSFPTAAGLASSASGFAALACAARVAAGLPHDPRLASITARRASASAARSIYGGFAVLPAGHGGERDLAASPLFPADFWDLRVVAAVITEGEKDVSSTRGMELSAQTSPYYDGWVGQAPIYFERVLEGVRARDLELAGSAMEASTFAMHACAMASEPPLIYFRGATLSAYETVRALRKRGTGAWATSDAGPHVKVFCEAADVASVEAALRETPGVLRTIVCIPGGPATVERV